MNGLALALVWGGVAVTVSGQFAYAAILIWGPPETHRYILPALLSLAGPMTGALGLIASRYGGKSQPYQEPGEHGRTSPGSRGGDIA